MRGVVVRGLYREGSKSRALEGCVLKNCEHPLYSKTFLDLGWYLVPRAWYDNPMCGRERADVIEKCGAQDKSKHHSVRGQMCCRPPLTENAPAFLVFDRKHVHRVIDELHNGGKLNLRRQLHMIQPRLLLATTSQFVPNGAKGLKALNLDYSLSPVAAWFDRSAQRARV